MSYVVMGVSGSGKSTVGLTLAKQLGIPFLDADDFHPPSNVEKMRNGIPLNDEDRLPWLQILAGKVSEHKDKGVVLACSALKESYRKIIDPRNQLNWVILHGERDMLYERIKSRKGHFMPPELLDSQIRTLEKPSYGLHLDISLSLDQIIEEIIKTFNNMETSEIGVIGMGVMGKSLALNLAEKGAKVSVYNRHVPGKEEKVAEKIVKDHSSYKMQGYDNLSEFVLSLQKPRVILMMVNAGKPVDDVISHVLPLIEAGDVLIDGGNSLFTDTKRRADELAEKKISFFGLGVSGGEEGARKGPSLMPGGSKEGYTKAERFFKLIAAKDNKGEACTTYVGPDGAGHFVKMIHNGIEYAEMQIIAEAYGILRHVCQLSPEKIADAFQKWQSEELSSFLLEISVDILRKKEGDGLLLDKILDAAEQKGTGGWSTKAALDLGVPFGPITEAVMARSLSARKVLREEAHKHYVSDHKKLEADEKILIQMRNAYQSARIINHAIGFDLLAEASRTYQWSLDLSELARIWTAGCIIRSSLMEKLSQVMKNNSRILLAPDVVLEMKSLKPSLSKVVCLALENDYPAPCLSSCLNYMNGLITANSSANMIQAQRDYFGAHTYRRIDAPADKYFHTEWKK